MHVVQHQMRHGRRVYPISRRRMHSVIERGVVSNSGVGLGELDGSILQNISRIVGGAVSTIATGGLVWLAPKKTRVSIERITGAMITSAGVGASIAPKLWGLSKSEANITRGITAGIAAVGGGVMLAPMMAGGTALTAPIGTASSGSSIIGTATGQVATTTGGGLLSTIGSGLSTVGSGLITGVKALTTILPVAGQVIGKGGGGEQVVQKQQGSDPYADQYYAQQQAAQVEYNRQQQAAYDEYIRQQQQQLYQPGMAIAQPNVSMERAYGDLRSPYTAITEDGEQVQVDPNTGQVIQPGMSTEMIVGGGAVALLLGWYLLS